MFRTILLHGKSFIGWLVLLVGTWLIASSAKEYIVEHLPDSSILTLFIVGIVVVMLSVALFGRKPPWI